MGWFDDALLRLAPGLAYRREAWRQGVESMRGYDAASIGRLSANWAAANQAASAEDSPSREIIRARARDLERNSDMMQAVLQSYTRNIVGKGYTLQAKTGDDAANKRLEALWGKWCKARNCDVTGDQNFTEMMRMALQRKKVDGGILIRKCYTGKEIPLQLQMLEVDELDTTATAPKHKGNRVVAGVEYDRHKKAVGYHIRQYGLEGWEVTGAEFVPAERMIFLWTKTRPSQIREISDMAPTITRIRDLNEYMTAVSVKERIAACLSVFIKKALPVGGLAGRNGQKVVSEYQRKTLTPGLIQELDAGDDVSVVNPAGTATDADSFLKTLRGMIAAGQGLSYETVSRDLSKTNYSSARQGVIEDNLTYEIDRAMLLGAMDEIYETFVISCVLAGLVDLPDFWGEGKERWLNHTWSVAPKPWVDPQKEANANQTAMQTMQKSYKDQCAENGEDWRQIIDDNAEAIAYAAERGIDLAAILIGQQAQQTAVPEETEEE